MTQPTGAPRPSAKPLGSDGIAAVAILLVASVSLRNWLPDSSTAVLLLRLVWVALYVGAVTALTLRFRGQWLAWILRQQPLLCILLSVALASCLWSIDPRVSLRTGVSLVGTTALGVFIGFSCSATQIVKILSWTFAILIVSSVLAVAVLPVPVSRAVGWRGIMDHKNTFGAAAELATVFFVVVTQRRGVRPAWREGALCALSFAALTRAHSRASIVTLGASLVALAYLTTLSAAGRPSLTTLRRLSLALVLCVSVLPFFVGPFAAALGNDDPLNGRTRLWSGVETILRERPLTGYGYEAVWRPDGATLLPHIPVTGALSATTAHNSILNIACELGIPAAAVACFYLFGALSTAARLFKREPTDFSTFTLLFVFSMTISGFAEAFLLRVHSIFWIAFVALTVAANRSLERLDNAQVFTEVSR